MSSSEDIGQLAAEAGIEPFDRMAAMLGTGPSWSAYREKVLRRAAPPVDTVDARGVDKTVDEPPAVNPAAAEPWSGQSILITGGSGFFGRSCVARLLTTEAKRICVFSRSEHVQAVMREEFASDRLRFFIGDVRDAQRLERAMHGVDLVIHAAALKRVEVGEYDASEMVKTNVIGAMNVIEAAQRSGVTRVVALSTDKACEPVNCYGASKLAAEKLFLAANNSSGGVPHFAVVRYGNVAGSTGSVIPTWRRALEQDRLVELTHPDATRFWMTVQHAVELVLQTAATMTGGELVIPELPAYRLEDLATAMGVRFSVTGLRPGEKLHESMRPGEASMAARRMSVDELRGELAHV